MKNGKAVTIRDVAKAAGVSVATVSSVLNNRSQTRISAETRERVLKVVKELGYRPRKVAQGLRKGLTYLIGLAIPLQPDQPLSPFFYEAVSGALKVAKERGWMVSILGFKDRDEELSILQKAVNQRLVDGVILFDPQENDPRFPVLKGNLPFVVIGRTDDPEICTVDNDNVEAAKLATQHLIRLGHKRIAFVHVPLSYFTAKDRLEGYKQALKEAGLPFRKELLVEADGYYGVEAGYRAMLSLLERLKERPTAVLAMDDTLALGCIQAAAEKGLKVPTDLAVVGFNGSAFSAHCEPPLTTVRIFAETLAYYAVDMLLRLVRGEVVAPSRVTVPTQLIVRKSCGTMR
ncbi:MAG: LacI family DNA-binding transcriptional regulator [Armatimonadota bacterium]|nr:LacI family transcriptional regulator [Armatimonadota bacterium]MDW8144058.1 LacI family DNA-binding transcriptional regulator [Armatimonadota bacterium]